MINYESIQRLAKEQGLSVKDFLVLAPANDPFYVGTPGEMAKGKWFAEQWHRFGYSDGVHLRRMHYRLVSQTDAVLKLDGEPYENTTNCWAYLCNTGKYARYLGLISPDAFIDRRNPTAQEYAPNRSSAPEFYRRTWQSITIVPPEWPDLPGFEYYCGQARQDYHVELWVEKSTMNDVLLPLCQKYGVNLVTGLGELSITAVRLFLKRASRQDKPCVILYIADFDPAGYRMPVSVARKIEYYAQQIGNPVTLQPIVLTQLQVDGYELPPMPFKKQANARRAANLGAFSDYAVELDALEALHPGELTRIVSEEIERYIDVELDDRQKKVYEAMKSKVGTARSEAIEPFIDDWFYLKAHFENATMDFEIAIKPIREQLLDLVRKIENALDGIEVDSDDFQSPTPKPADPYSEPLFCTSRDYGEQLRVYRAYDAGTMEAA